MGTSDRDRYGNVTGTPTIAIAAGNQFYVVTPQGQRLFTLPREHDPAQYDTVMAAMTPNGRRFFFWYAPSEKARRADSHVPSYVTEVSAQGVVLRHDTLRALPPSAPPAPPDLSGSAFGLLAPPLVPLALAVYVPISHAQGDSFTDSLRQVWSDSAMSPLIHLFLAVSFASGLISALLAWLIARRCVLPPRARWLWAAGVFWLGGYGVLLLLALREWPARVPCPQCGRQRVVNRDQCAHCGSPFERPQRDGTEIFDDANIEVPSEAQAVAQ